MLASLAGLLTILLVPGGTVLARRQIPATSSAATVTLPGYTLRIAAPAITPTTKPGVERVRLVATLTNTGKQAFTLHTGDFMLSAEGDVFGPVRVPNQPGAFAATVAPAATRSVSLAFLVPVAAIPASVLLYRPAQSNAIARLPLTALSPPAAARATDTSTVNITEYPLNGGVGEPWGTAIDAAGNVWFAEPGCDFAPTCSPSDPPGQIGELVADSHALHFYTLPDISGNQPIFLALDASGNIWFTTPNNSMIGEFDPQTQQFLGQWPVTPGSGPWDLTFNKGMIWYTEHLVSSIGEFNPQTHTHQDFATPSPNSNPYGIAADGNYVWFTENNSSVARIGVLSLARHNRIYEFPIRAQLSNGLTPHMLALDYRGFPWWTEGFVRAIGVLNPWLATPGQCGTSSGDCKGVTEYNLPPPPSSCPAAHTSGIAIQGRQLVWADDSLSAQVGNFDPYNQQFTLYSLSNCNAHPHDGLNLDAAYYVWWDEEFANALGALTP